MGAAIVLLSILYLGSNKLAAPTRHITPTSDPRTGVESGAAKPPEYRPIVHTMPAFLRRIEQRVQKMPDAQRQAIMDKIKAGNY